MFGGGHYIIFNHPYIGDIWKKKLDIKKSDTVLEIGSGWNPSVRSDVLIEKFISDRKERRYVAYIPKARPFIIADGCHLPFIDNAFDYIICRHVIEHIEDPEEMLKEMKRLAKKGYISAPSGYEESISAGAYHKWFVFIKDGKLILEQKRERSDRRYQKEARIIKPERQVEYEYNPHNPLKWKIIRNAANEEFVSADLDQDYERALLAASKKVYPIFVKMRIIFRERIRQLFFKTSKKIDIYALLACPICKSKLTKIKDMLFCHYCKRKYQMINNIPILLREKAMKS